MVLLLRDDCGYWGSNPVALETYSIELLDLDG